MTDIAEKIAHKYLHREGTPVRVAARFMSKEARNPIDPSRMDGKIVGKDARLFWNRDYFFIEELPQKGKKKLYSGQLDLNNRAYQHSNLLPVNLLRDAKIGSGDDYKAMQKKLDSALEKAFKDAEDPKSIARYGEIPDWMKKTKWWGDEVYYLHVRPEGVDAFSVIAKDFKMNVTWEGFKAYSPSSDLQQSDPHYSYYESKGPTAARTAYKILKADPEALRSVSWHDFDKWMKKNKIAYNIQFSNWS